MPEFLPESHTDFIVAVLPKFGFVGMMLPMAVYFPLSCAVSIFVTAQTLHRLLAAPTMTFFIYIFVNVEYRWPLPVVAFRCPDQLRGTSGHPDGGFLCADVDSHPPPDDLGAAAGTRLYRNGESPPGTCYTLPVSNDRPTETIQGES